VEVFVRAWLCAFVLTTGIASPAFAGPEEDALRVPDATFLGTGSRTVVLKTDEIRQYFERALLADRPRGAVLESRSVMTLSDGAVVVTGLDTTTAVRGGKSISSPGRVTFVIAKRGADWKIVHFHRSGMPGRPN
jgi:hypothetical protein